MPVTLDNVDGMDASAETLDIPPALRAALKAAAAEECRSAGELLRDAVERYLSERRWFRGDDVHGKISQGLESLTRGNGLDGEVVMAELLAELDLP